MFDVNLTPFRSLTLGLILMLVAAGAAAADTVEVKVADHDWPPFGFAGDSEAPPGIIREVAGLCLSEAGFAAEFEYLPLNRLFAYLEQGKLDLNVMSFSKQREVYAHYGSEPVFTSRYLPFVRVGESIELNRLADFDELRLGHLAGLRYSEDFRLYVDQRIEDGTVVTTPTQESLIQMLLAGHIDVFVLPEESVAWRVKKMGVQGQLRSLAMVIRSSEYFFTVSRASPRVTDAESLLGSLDGCIRDLRQDGRLRSIFAPYGLAP